MSRRTPPHRPELAARSEPGNVKLPSGLYVVATPIGNLADLTLRARSVLAEADLVLCEDRRVTRKLLDRYRLRPTLLPYHEHNAEQVRPKVLARLAKGDVVAIVSDAGTPLISDPGFKLVRSAIAQGHPVFPIPGPSAVLAALVAAGLPTDRFFFEGFLPPKASQRRARIAKLAAIPATLILYETGPRLVACLADLAAGLGPRAAAVCRELTKAFEEIRRGSLADLVEQYTEAPKGEIVIVVGPPAAAERPSADDLDQRLRAALARTSVKDAALAVSKETGLPRRDVYQRALALRSAGAER